MDLFRILLCFRDGKNLQFCFKSEANCQKAFALLTQPPMPDMVPGKVVAMVMPADVVFADDYGNTAKVVIGDLSCVVHTDVNQDLHSQTDLQILQAHNEVWREKKMENDPIIREAMKRMQARAALAGMNGQRQM